MEATERRSADRVFLEGDLRRGLFPAEAEPEQVMEIVKVLANIDGGLDVLELEKILKIDADQSARLVNACQMLDLTRIHDGRVVLTENGTRLNDLSKTEKGNFLAGRLASIEPFRTAIEIAGKQKTVSVETVVDALSRLKLRWTEEGDDELNELLVHNILVDWVVFAGLLQYDGRADKFRAKIVVKVVGFASRLNVRISLDSTNSLLVSKTKGS